MKKSIFFILTLIMMTAAPLTAIHAAAADVNVSYDYSTKALTVSGTMGTLAGQAVSVVILPDGTDVGSVTDATPALAADAVHTTAQGSYTSVIPLPASLPSNKYTVYAASAYGTGSAYFMYPNDTTVAALLPQINAASSAPALEAVLTANRTALAIDPLTYNDNKTSIANIMYHANLAGQSGFSSNLAFMKAYDQALVATLIANGGDVSSLLLRYAPSLDMDYTQDFLSYPSAVRDLLASTLKTCDFTAKPFPRLYKEMRVLSFVRAVNTWGGLKYAVLGIKADGTQFIDNFAVLDPDTTYYNKLKNKDKVFQDMFVNFSGLTSFDNIVTSFEQCSKAAYDSEKSTGSSGGGGGSSGKTTASIEGAAPVIPTTSALFSDMNGHWANGQVTALAAKGIIAGFPDKTFKPENPVTRAEFVKMIVSAFHISAQNTVRFSDVADSEWYTPYISAAASNGVVKGVTDSAFEPDGLITRQDASVIMYRCLTAYSKLTAAQPTFGDASTIADYARDAVGTLASAGIINGGSDRQFDPNGLATRAQAAALIGNSLDYMLSH